MLDVKAAHTPDTGHLLILPEVFEPVGRQGGVAHGMLNILMSQIILDGSGIMPLRREVIAARMPELMGMGHKEEHYHLARGATIARIARGDKGALRSQTNTYGESG